MRVGYARVSTEEQFLDLQFSALKIAGCDPIFSDHGVWGTRRDRQGLSQALSRLERGDTLVVWRLDRLGRSLSQLVILMSGLRDRGVHFASLNEAIDTDSPTGMFMFHMIAALAEFERALISERTKAGLAAARHRGSKLGRPRALSAQELEEAKDLVKTYPEAFVAKQFGVHVKTLRTALYPRQITQAAS
ncbi:recombinase family protein [Burkholderia vietnamiensis]|uniref:recombinase family protein n=1 Tax=Burkholderia vietnamiensis TaxID=60552 RepID=UPI001CF321E1|nr:recombinase family protein [Burkholderia vietnamiensis]MCA8291871.1 recombinase family protein [Burkholderia vietnamiensis]